MRVLVVGGTGFLGGAVAHAAHEAGHSVAILTRALTKGLPRLEGIDRLTADRHGDLRVVNGREFDLVVDTCAFTPDAVEHLLDALSPAPGRYAFVSSSSVYSSFAVPGTSETAPTSRATDEDLAMARHLAPGMRSSAASYGSAYGPLKRESELVAIDRLGAGAFILRSGLLVGAGDYTDRLTYWVRRVDQGGIVAVPGDPHRLVQLIDVRDAARFIIEGAEQNLNGVFNLTGQPMAMSTLLEQCRTVANSDARFEWVPDEVALATGVEPWSEAPLWIPQSDATYRHFLEVDASKAFASGLRTRPLEETVQQILAWDRSRRDMPLKTGLSREKEAALLTAVTAPV
jgi:2'-hydroxyisoflavone reductase